MTAFTPGSIVVYRIGTGAAANTSAATAVFIDEYSQTGTLIQSIAMPTMANATASGNDALTASGTATSEGQISDAADGQSILLAGYNATTGTTSVANSTASATANQRVVGIVNANGTIDTTTNVGTFDSGNSNNARSAASFGTTGSNSTVYFGSPQGVAITTDGSTTTPTTTVDTTNTRDLQAVSFNGNNVLYYSTGSGANPGIYSLGATPTGTVPTNGSSGAGTLLASSPTPMGFTFANLGTTVGTQPDTLYVVDTTNGIEKFTLNPTTGQYALATTGGTVTAGTSGGGTTASLLGTATALAGVSVVPGGTAGTATLFVTTASGLYKLTDTGANGLSGPATLIAAAPTNEVFRGDALAPQAAACYREGTLIRTSRGDVAIEALRVGDLVETISGKHRPIRWLGHRAIDVTRHPDPRAAMPIRIAAHALAPNKPARDLYVSPGHAICFNVCGEVLLPASSLVNGATIRQVEVETITYWHVELESHDILIAENLPSETYLDMGNRGFFAESVVIDLDATPDVDPARRTAADFCRPLFAVGVIVEAVREQLATRAASIGWTLDGSDRFAGLHLVVDGIRIDPATRGQVARFAVPANASDVWLVSGATRPCDVQKGGDIRALGVCVARLAIDDGFVSQEIALDDPLLSHGFHDLEDGCRRWTSGRARLPAALWETQSEDFFLRIDLAGTALPQWVAPAAKVQKRMAFAS